MDEGNGLLRLKPIVKPRMSGILGLRGKNALTAAFC